MSAEQAPLRVVVVEDEAPQRRQLTAWLGDMEGVIITGEAADGISAIRVIDAEEPDLVLLDITLPEKSGLEVAAAIAHAPEIVFTTAHRDFAIEAFELGAVDYLLKPFGASRVADALARVRSRTRDARPGEDSITARMTSVADSAQPLSRIFVRERNGIVPVPVGEIIRLEADGDYTAVITATRRHLVAVPLKALLERLHGQDFLRVHRQHVVNMAHVSRIEPHDAARLEVFFASGASIVASRAGSQLLRGLLG